MAVRKTGSRRIVVDGVAYRWRIRHRATYCQADYGRGVLHVAIESAEQPGTVLVLITDRPHPKDCIPRPLTPATPSDIAGWIRQAIGAGWTPSEPGPQFKLHLSGSSAERIG
jgi:hypothetical protein